MRNFFKGSPQKPKHPQPSRSSTPQPPQLPPAPAWHPPENLARYLKDDGTLARAFVNFNDVKDKCDTCLLELAIPLVAQRASFNGKPAEAVHAGDLILNLFRLPPLPVPPETLPQSLEECQRGLDHVMWHKVTYMEGTLTQNGGDCTVSHVHSVMAPICTNDHLQSWRRRQLRLIGGNLVAYNDVTKKATTSIDLRQAISVEDDDEARESGDNVDGWELGLEVCRPVRWAGRGALVQDRVHKWGGDLVLCGYR
jgi:hypothetical protein